ncbi:Protein phosphatase methylesterase 1 [Morus notabilis]|uniref:protein phosphatase methylesterase-1 n=1 Tax=Morus notabilis TaxID=981085 RepID=W9SDC5_9ROSA|nr:Protein phosphatase methylesterase 1 [Morus notabilis]
MDSSTLASLPEERESTDQPQQQDQSLSAFASLPHRPPTQTSLQKYSPVDWLGYFDREDDICIPDSNDVFHVYMAGKEGPVVFCLHGGGYSGLSFALSAKIIKEKARVVAMDLRGHGKSTSENDLDLSIETMCNDVVAVVKAMYGDSPPAIVLVGHSMGGSVAVHVAARKAIPSLAGLVVVDVVESLTHISPSEISGYILLLFSSRIRLLTLNAYYNAIVDTGVVRTSRAITESVRKRSVLLFHHCKMSSLSSSIIKFDSKYLTNSVDTCVDDDPDVFSFFFKKLHDEPLGSELLAGVNVPCSF